jgi:hypothetical protein
LDAQGSGKIAEIAKVVRSQGIDLRLARLKTNAWSVPAREGAIAAIGEDHV